MRNITAQELVQLALYHREMGRAEEAKKYEQEELELQREMDRD